MGGRKRRRSLEAPVPEVSERVEGVGPLVEDELGDGVARGENGMPRRLDGATQHQVPDVSRRRELAVAGIEEDGEDGHLCWA